MKYFSKILPSLVGLNIALGILVMLCGGYFIWGWHADWVTTAQKPPISPTLEKKTFKQARGDAIVRTHLFGKSLNDGGAVPLSSLQFKVSGIVKTETHSKAYISLSGARAKIFSIGDNLPFGAKVYDIQDNAVILENDGRLESIPLDRPKLIFKSRNHE